MRRICTTENFERVAHALVVVSDGYVRLGNKPTMGLGSYS